MATSSSDGSCAAPVEFQLSSELEDVPHRQCVNLLKCPLCHNRRRIFYCRHCIQNGDFVHSTSVYSERFADKQLRLLRLKAAKLQLEDRCMRTLEKVNKKDKLICDIKTCKERVRLLQSLVIETRQSINADTATLQSIHQSTTGLTMKLPYCYAEINEFQEYITQMKRNQVKLREAMERKRQLHKKAVRTASQQLIDYIFPISQIKPNRSLYSSEDEGVCGDLVSCALADASRTSYIRGRWVSDTENSLEMQHCIVAPTLPGTGDYSAYSVWVAANKDGVPGGNKENAMHNPGYTISAALTYTTQLINVLAFYLDVKLPYKLPYSEFCGNEMSDQKFARKVARLNSNVLHLCFTQNTKLSHLHATHTLQNILHLLNPEVSNLGRGGPMQVDSASASLLHRQLNPDLDASDDSASDEEDDTFNWEWEAVPHVMCPEMMLPIPGGIANHQSSTSMQVNQSMAGGLVTSAANSLVSIWRGLTTNR